MCGVRAIFDCSMIAFVISIVHGSVTVLEAKTIQLCHQIRIDFKILVVHGRVLKPETMKFCN